MGKGGGGLRPEVRARGAGQYMARKGRGDATRMLWSTGANRQGAHAGQHQSRCACLRSLLAPYGPPGSPDAPYWTSNCNCSCNCLLSAQSRKLLRCLVLVIQSLDEARQKVVRTQELYDNRNELLSYAFSLEHKVRHHAHPRTSAYTMQCFMHS